jgi:hypothetical protein
MGERVIPAHHLEYRVWAKPKANLIRLRAIGWSASRARACSCCWGEERVTAPPAYTLGVALPSRSPTHTPRLLRQPGLTRWISRGLRNPAIENLSRRGQVLQTPGARYPLRSNNPSKIRTSHPSVESEPVTTASRAIFTRLKGIASTECSNPPTPPRRCTFGAWASWDLDCPPAPCAIGCSHR